MNSIIQRKPLIIIVIAVAIIGLGGSYFLYGRSAKMSPDVALENETEMLVAAVGKLMELPTDETPTIATVLDKEKLTDQPFFKIAQNGDRLIAYDAAHMAILYRPETNKIINVATINGDRPQINPESEPAADTKSSPRIAYYNGTDVQGFAKKIAQEVSNLYPNSKTAIITNALKKGRDTTLVIDLSGTYGAVASDLAEKLQGTTGQLPEGEIAPLDTDILIITGK